MFAGSRAKLFDTANVLFQSPWDGKARFEIDDSQARLLHSPRIINQLGKRDIELPLADFIRHEAYFANYPDMRNFPVRFDAGTTGAALVLEDHKPHHMIMGVQAGVPLETNLDTLHEMQHLTQYQEDFVTGSSVSWEISLERQRRLARLKLTARRRPDKADCDDLAQIMEGIKNNKGPVQAQIITRGRQRYHFGAGEIEARDTERRIHLSAAQRQQQPAVLQTLSQLGPRARIAYFKQTFPGFV